VPSLDPEEAGGERLITLALGALRALVRDAELTRDELRSSALLLALPEAGPDVAGWDLARAFAPALLGRAGIDPPARVAVDQSGHGAALVLLEAAARLLHDRKVGRCVLVAVDSYLDAERLTEWDERRGRLRSDRNPDGFLPGEAAVALLFEPPGERRALAAVAPPAFGVEPQPIGGDKNGLNGESHRAFEWGLARMRLTPALDEARVRHPADCVGDVGAASGALLVGLAAHLLERGRAATSALVFTASSAGQRAATLVSAA
jgi:3-oxoacyl-[acyl-carrier-protein] synthase-1